MLVGNRMTKEPVTITADVLLNEAEEKMRKGGFRRLPVIGDGKLVGIITDRDLRAHVGYLERTRANGVMTEKVRTVSPTTTLEEAAQILLHYQIGGLPVVDDGRLVGIITTSDVMKAFLDTTGASQPASNRIDFVLEGGRARSQRGLESRVARRWRDFGYRNLSGKNWGESRLLSAPSLR